jgi:hypothetical protein
MSIEQPIDPDTSPQVENEDHARMENIGKRDDGKLKQNGRNNKQRRIKWKAKIIKK